MTDPRLAYTRPRVLPLDWTGVLFLSFSVLSPIMLEWARRETGAVRLSVLAATLLAPIVGFGILYPPIVRLGAGAVPNAAYFLALPSQLGWSIVNALFGLMAFGILASVPTAPDPLELPLAFASMVVFPSFGLMVTQQFVRREIFLRDDAILITMGRRLAFFSTWERVSEVQLTKPQLHVADIDGWEARLETGITVQKATLKRILTAVEARARKFPAIHLKDFRKGEPPKAEGPSGGKAPGAG